MFLFLRILLKKTEKPRKKLETRNIPAKGTLSPKYHHKNITKLSQNLPRKYRTVFFKQKQIQMYVSMKKCLVIIHADKRFHRCPHQPLQFHSSFLFKCNVLVARYLCTLWHVLTWPHRFGCAWTHFCFCQTRPLAFSPAPTQQRRDV